MKEIQIDTRNLIPAPLDDKNILVESIMNNLFDDEGYTFDKNEYMGFVGGWPTYAEHHGNFMRLRFVKPESDVDTIVKWASAVIKHLTLGDGKDVHSDGGITKVQYIDDFECWGTPYIMTFTLSDDIITVTFHWDAEDK